GEIPEPIDRYDHRLVKRRDVKGGRQMREVMLDIVEGPVERLARKCLPQQFRGALPLVAIPEPLEHQSRLWNVGQQVADLPGKIGPAVLVERNMVDIGE